VSIETRQVEIGSKPLTVETGHLAKQASGSVTVRQGDTLVLVTAQASPNPKDLPFLPLTVEYREGMYAGGKVPGGFFKREGRPNEKETLTCRLIDRPLRPLFPKGWTYETQIISMVLSYDKETNPDVLALTGASTALCLSDIPWHTPIAAVRVGLIDGEYLINPDNSVLSDSRLDLVVAASSEGIVMVEAGAQQATEDEIIEGLYRGQEAVQPLIGIQNDLASVVGKPKREHEPPEPPVELKSMVLSEGRQPLADAMMVKDKADGASQRQAVMDRLLEKVPEDDETSIRFVKELFDEMQDEILHEHVLANRTRLDGRNLDEIRTVTPEVSVLPRTHGSSVFTRGETQALVITTLGTSADTQRIDTLEFDGEKRFMLHYNFPPFSVGEVRFLRGPGRREIGHGALAERSIKPLLPSEEDFPYTIRLVSDILESNGSSSMASVCGGSLALFDAGVPLAKPVAGIAMGLVMGDDGEYAILTDIAGAEDHHGDMDFKVAGTHDGITALQMDIKISGVNRQLMKEALAQAKKARLELLDKMGEALPAPRTEISRYAPRILTIRISRDKIRDVIGPGGKIIRSIQEKTGCEISIEDDGRVDIASVDLESAEQAAEIIKELTAEAELNKIYLGKVVRTTSFGAFVEILPGVDGLLHISEIADHRVKNTTDEIEEGDEVLVKVIDIDAQGRVRLSRKQAMKEREATE
jgi:polyribonucleotide nucleotidyltransferase